MKTIEFKCKVITPLILGEAKKGEVEFRPPAIKSAIRFWWRAMHSHLADIKTLKEKEAAIFGGGGEKAIAAKFDLIVSSDSTSSPYNYESGQTIESINKNDDSMKGLQYLAFSLIHLKHKGNYFATGSDFVLHFFFKDDDIETPQQVLASFCLFSMLGNLGERSRRGLGSFKVEAITNNSGFDLHELNYINYDNYTLRKNLTKIDNLFNPSHTSNMINSYSHIYNKLIYVSIDEQPFKSWNEALNDVGLNMKNFRLVESNGRDRSPYLYHVSAAFGLPLKHSNKNVVKPVDEDLPRRASPVQIKIIQTKESEFHWLLIRYEGDFLPLGRERLTYCNQHTDMSILDTFFVELESKMTKL